MIKTLFETKLTDVKSTDVEGVGTVRHESNGDIYIWLKNTATTALTAKQPVCYEVATVGSRTLFKTCLTPATADLMLAAGIAITAIGASGANMYGWVQCRGYVSEVPVLAVSGTAIAVGDTLKGVNGQTYLAKSIAAGTAPAYTSSFVLLEVVSDATGATVYKDVYVNCLFGG